VAGTGRRDHGDGLVGAGPGDIAPQQRARARVLGDLLAPVAQERCGDTIDDFRLPPAERIVEIARRRARPARRALELVDGSALDALANPETLRYSTRGRSNCLRAPRSPCHYDFNNLLREFASLLLG
jgi:hypothetical protein